MNKQNTKTDNSKNGNQTFKSKNVFLADQSTKSNVFKDNDGNKSKDSQPVITLEPKGSKFKSKNKDTDVTKSSENGMKKEDVTKDKRDDTLKPSKKKIVKKEKVQDLAKVTMINRWKDEPEVKIDLEKISQNGTKDVSLCEESLNKGSEELFENGNKYNSHFITKRRTLIHSWQKDHSETLTKYQESESIYSSKDCSSSQLLKQTKCINSYAYSNNQNVPNEQTANSNSNKTQSTLEQKTKFVKSSKLKLKVTAEFHPTKDPNSFTLSSIPLFSFGQIPDFIPKSNAFTQTEEPSVGISDNKETDRQSLSRRSSLPIRNDVRGT